MTTLDEQQARHSATMSFFKAAAEIAAELKKLEEDQRQAVEREWQGRCVKPEERVEGD